MFNSTRRLCRHRPGLDKYVRHASVQENVERATPQFRGIVKIMFGMAVSFVGGAYCLLKLVDDYMIKHKPSFENLEKAASVDIEVVKSSRELVFEKALTALEKAQIDPKILTKDFVNRPDIESKIQEVFSTKKPVNYYLVYGPRGVGKSEIVAQTASNPENKYVVWQKVTSASNRDELIKGLLFDLTGQEANMTAGVLQNIILEFKANHNDAVPTIIFDVERGSATYATLQTVRGLAKDLVNYCRFIIVLPDASAVVSIKRDRARERLIYVYEMTTTEAKEYLTKLGAKFEENDLQLIFNSIGTAPADLKDLVDKVCDKNMRIQDYVNYVLGEAIVDLDNFPLKPILKALQAHPDGVPTSYFAGQKFNSVELNSPDAVFRCLNKSIDDEGGKPKPTNVLVYRTDLKMYQLASTAHKTALKSYNIPSYSWWSWSW